MQTIIQALRTIVGTPSFYQGSGTYQTLDYGAVFEYVLAGLLVLVVVSSVFKIVTRLFFGQN